MKEQKDYTQQPSGDNRSQHNDFRGDEAFSDEPVTGKHDPSPIYVTDHTTLQTPQESAHDRSLDPRTDNTREASNDDLHETKADHLAGSDRAGTAERKDNTV